MLPTPNGSLKGATVPDRQSVLGPVLITGGSGYIGTALAQTLCHYSEEVRILSRRSPAPGIRARHFQGDVTSLQTVRDATDGITAVFHLAGQTSVNVAHDKPHVDFDANVVSMLTLIRALTEANSKATIINAGTVTQVGLQTRSLIDESCPDSPATIYDAHKLTAEKYLEFATHNGLVRGVSLRLANVYGPGPRSTTSDRGVLNEMIKKAMSGQTLTIFGSGNYLRDYIYITDVADAFVAAAQHSEAIAGEHFVIGTGARQTFAHAVRTVAAQASARTKKGVPVVHVEPPRGLDPINMRSYVVDSSRFRRATKWTPKIQLDQGIGLTMDCLINGPDSQCAF